MMHFLSVVSIFAVPSINSKIIMSNTWYNVFLEKLSIKYPKKSQLAEALMDLLSIERESAYRRLRGEIIFPAGELVKIALAWNISLDEVIGVDSQQVIFKTKLLNYIQSSEEEVESMQKIIQGLNFLTGIPDLEYLEACNKMPRSLTSGFPYLRRLQLLEWMYQFSNDEVLPFSQIAFLPEVAKLSSEYYMCIKNLAQVSFVWDYMIFNSVVCSIRYFHSIDLITNEEKEFIKNDLYALIDYMSEVAAKGHWLETGNKVNLYISHINIDANYSYYYSETVKICRVHAFVKNEISTSNPATVENFKNWMQLKKRSSVLISETNEKARIDFFKKQQQLVDEL